MSQYRRRLTKVERPHSPTEEYDYEEHTEDYLERIIRKRLPEDRYLEIDYYKTKDKIEKNKVMCLRAPADNNEKVDLYRFEYSRLGREGKGIGETFVYDAYNHLTHYQYFLKTQRLAFIVKYKKIRPIPLKSFCGEKKSLKMRAI